MIYRKPEHQNDRAAGHRCDQAGALRQGGEFVVLQRHRTRYANAHAVRTIEPKPIGGSVDRVDGLLPGPQLGEIEPWIDQDDVAQLVRVRRLPGHQAAPGEEGRPVVRRTLESNGEISDRGPQVLRRGLPGAHALHRERERIRETA
jgi:hypothetical protein